MVFISYTAAHRPTWYRPAWKTKVFTWCNHADRLEQPKKKRRPQWLRWHSTCTRCPAMTGEALWKAQVTTRNSESK